MIVSAAKNLPRGLANYEVIQKLTTDTSVTGQICSVAKHAVLPQWLQRQGKWFQYILLKARRLVQGFCTSSPG